MTTAYVELKELAMEHGWRPYWRLDGYVLWRPGERIAVRFSRQHSVTGFAAFRGGLRVDIAHHEDTGKRRRLEELIKKESSV